MYRRGSCCCPASDYEKCTGSQPCAAALASTSDAAAARLGAFFSTCTARRYSTGCPHSPISRCKSLFLFLLATFVCFSLYLFSLPAHLVFLSGDPYPDLPYGSPLNKVWSVQGQLGGPWTCSSARGPLGAGAAVWQTWLRPSCGEERGSPEKVQGRAHTSLVHVD